MFKNWSVGHTGVFAAITMIVFFFGLSIGANLINLIGLGSWALSGWLLVSGTVSVLGAQTVPAPCPVILELLVLCKN